MLAKICYIKEFLFVFINVHTLMIYCYNFMITKGLRKYTGIPKFIFTTNQSYSNGILL